MARKHVADVLQEDTNVTEKGMIKRSQWATFAITYYKEAITPQRSPIAKP